ncbi:MAG: tubulin-like doman-containing protein [Anaerobutyricum sp.]
MLKNKSGFVGIGAYAGNQLLPFYKDGYPCLFANTATTDLDSLTEVDEQYKYQIPGGEGCNKDRIKSRELFRKDIDNIINEVKEKLPGIEYLFVVASLGGGTGAGSVMPMKRVAMNDLDIKACIVITVLPNTKTESIQALINSYETLAELEALEEPGTMFILDNDKNNNKMKINEIFFCHLDALLTLDCNSALGNIDDAEVEQMLCSRGVSM